MSSTFGLRAASLTGSSSSGSASRSPRAGSSSSALASGGSLLAARAPVWICLRAGCHRKRTAVALPWSLRGANRDLLGFKFESEEHSTGQGGPPDCLVGTRRIDRRTVRKRHEVHPVRCGYPDAQVGAEERRSKKVLDLDDHSVVFPPPAAVRLGFVDERLLRTRRNQQAQVVRGSPELASTVRRSRWDFEECAGRSAPHADIGLAFRTSRRAFGPPTARIVHIFEHVARHHLTAPDGTVLRTFAPELTDLQHQILDLLDIPTSLYTAT